MKKLVILFFAILMCTTASAQEWVEHAVDGDSFGACSAYAMDIDGDGDIDVLAAATFAHEITWSENTDGLGTVWTEHTVDGNFGYTESVYATDIDGDGDIDVVGAATEDLVTWWENVAGSGTVWTEHTVDNNIDNPRSVYATDIDGDGDTDVLGAAYFGDEIIWWENVDGAGSAWNEHTVDGAFEGAISVYATDMDGDGDTDVLGGGFHADEITWWENTNGVGTVWTEHTIDGDFEAFSVYATDIDGDGDVDVFGGDTGFSVQGLTWWENVDGAGTVWTEYLLDGDCVGVRSVYATDVDGDGDTDLLAADQWENNISWWENENGDGSEWIRHTVIGDFEGPQSVYATDIDGDGDIDVLGAANPGYEIAWWEQVNAELTLVPHQTTVPSGGGHLIFDVTLSIPGNVHMLHAQFWTELTFPNGGECLLHMRAFEVDPFMNLSFSDIATQNVPAAAPPGIYTYTASAGRNGFPRLIEVTDSFEFEKLGDATVCSNYVFKPDDWQFNGLDFGSEAGDVQATIVPDEFMVTAPYPNPFNSTTCISIRLPETTKLEVTVFSVTGQRVVKLANGRYQAGSHTLTFDASNLASGLYFIRATVPGQLDQVQKVILVR